MAEIHIDISEEIDLKTDVTIVDYNASDLCLKVGEFSIVLSDKVAEKLWSELGKWFEIPPKEEV